jgi:phosphate-selective porin OprO/OprP
MTLLWRKQRLLATTALAAFGAMTVLPGMAQAEDTAAEIRALKAELEATIGEVRALKAELHHYQGKSAEQDRKINAVAAKASRPVVVSANELITKGPIAPTAFPYIVDLSHGFTIATTDRSDYFHVGGRMFVDGGASTQPVRGLSEAANFNQARLQVEGRLRNYWEYKFQYDFVGGSNATTVGAPGGIRDAYLAFIHPALNPGFLPNPIEVQVGNFYLPHGLERSAYSKINIDFNERALMSDTFGASRHIGAALLTHGNNWFAKAAISSTSFEDASLKPASETAVPLGVGDQANWVSTGGRQYYDLTARASWAPIWQEDELLHIGASGRYHRPNDSTAANDDRVLTPGSNTASESNLLKENFLGTPDLSCSNVPTGNVGVTADPNGYFPGSTATGYAPLFGSQISQTAVAGHCLKSVLTFGAELAAAYGPLFFQAEYMGSQYNRDPYAVLRANYVASMTNSFWAPTAKGFTPYPFSPGGASEYFSGYYLYAMWFLTGETKAAAYQVDSNTNGGGFARVPIKNPMSAGGFGAVALTARLSEVDLNSGPFQGNTYNNLYALAPLGAFGSKSFGLTKLAVYNSGVLGGRQEDMTLGLNWYPEPGIAVKANWTRVMELTASYSQPWTNGAHPNLFVVRTQVDW